MRANAVVLVLIGVLVAIIGCNKPDQALANCLEANAAEKKTREAKEKARTESSTFPTIEDINSKQVFILLDRSISYGNRAQGAFELAFDALERPDVLSPGDRFVGMWIGGDPYKGDPFFLLADGKPAIVPDVSRPSITGPKDGPIEEAIKKAKETTVAAETTLRDPNVLLSPKITACRGAKEEWEKIPQQFEWEKIPQQIAAAEEAKNVWEKNKEAARQTFLSTAKEVKTKIADSPPPLASNSLVCEAIVFASQRISGMTGTGEAKKHKILIFSDLEQYSGGELNPPREQQIQDTRERCKLLDLKGVDVSVVMFDSRAPEEWAWRKDLFMTIFREANAGGIVEFLPAPLVTAEDVAKILRR